MIPERFIDQSNNAFGGSYRKYEAVAQKVTIARQNMINGKKPNQIEHRKLFNHQRNDKY